MHEQNKHPLLIELPINEESWYCDNALCDLERGVLCCPIGKDKNLAPKCQTFYSARRKYQAIKSAQKQNQ